MSESFWDPWTEEDKKTIREIWIQIWNGMKGQGFKKSILRATPLESGSCRYRHPDLPLKCVAGHLIPDEKYSPVFENNAVYNLYRSLEENRDGACGPAAQFFTSIYTKGVCRFLLKAQNVHDHSADSDVEAELREFAKIHGLSIPSEEG